MKNRIYYIGFYNHPIIANENRMNFPAADNKMNYVIDILIRSNYNICVINPSWTKSPKNFKGKYNKINSNLYLKTFFTIPWTNRLFKSLSSRIMKLQLFFYLLFHIKKSDKIIVYHSIFYAKLVNIIARFKKINIILEVEEVYQDINELTKKEKKNEYKIFNIASGYIYSTENLRNIINNTKPNIVISGNYLLKPILNNDFHDKKKHIIYAGIIDSKKMGAFRTLDIAKNFSQDYVFDILGFGNEEDIEILKNKIKSYNLKNESKVYYHGVLYGKELDEFLQKCEYGLSTQSTQGKYNNSSFPSKLINYLTNGLKVITVDIPVIRMSKINKLVYYYENIDDILEIIKEKEISKKDIRSEILKIDQECCKEIKKLMRDVYEKFN